MPNRGAASLLNSRFLKPTAIHLHWITPGRSSRPILSQRNRYRITKEELCVACNRARFFTEPFMEYWEERLTYKNGSAWQPHKIHYYKQILTLASVYLAYLQGF